MSALMSGLAWPSVPQVPAVVDAASIHGWFVCHLDQPIQMILDRPAGSDCRAGDVFDLDLSPFVRQFVNFERVVLCFRRSAR